jgi:tetratricopeptide (TPR) repeat protein
MRWWAAVATGSMLALPAAAETLRVEGVFAAQAREASLLPTIAVGPFAGPEGEDLADAIERRLAKLGTDGLPHVRLIPPALRPDGLLTGRTGVQVASSDYREGRERCAEKKDGKCVRKERYSVACVRRTIALRADLEVRRRTGALPYATTKTRDDRADWCEDGGVATSVEGVVSGMIESVAAEVQHDLAPHAEDYTIRVIETRDGLPPEAAGRFRQAVRLTKRDPAAACAAFAEVDRMAPDNGATAFNLALCAEAAGRYREAADRYARARLFAPYAGGEISKGLLRVAALAAGAQDVASMRARPPLTGSGF